MCFAILYPNGKGGLMKPNHKNYLLDFTIPEGITGKLGPTGPQGPIGPTGPATLEDVIFVQYNNSFTNGLLTIFNATIFPNHSSLFGTNGNQISIKQPGNYEFTLCGKLNGNAVVNIQSVNTQGRLTNLTTITAQKASMLFSKTGILEITEPQKMHLLFSINTTGANAEPLKFMIKKLPF